MSCTGSHALPSRAVLFGPVLGLLLGQPGLLWTELASELASPGFAWPHPTMALSPNLMTPRMAKPSQAWPHNTRPALAWSRGNHNSNHRRPPGRQPLNHRCEVSLHLARPCASLLDPVQFPERLRKDEDDGRRVAARRQPCVDEFGVSSTPAPTLTWSQLLEPTMANHLVDPQQSHLNTRHRHAKGGKRLLGLKYMGTIARETRYSPAPPQPRRIDETCV